jgi:phospholipid/cholesterol/gamma-HCH transport system substrate-binding protein
MKNLKLNYLIVGSFMIGIIVLLVVAVTLLTGRNGATDEYYAVYDNVAGVQFGTRVLYEGFPIGQVDEIVPQQTESRTRFRVEMSVTEHWKIPKDSTAEIAASGILAAVTINIRAGQSTELLKPGTQIPARESNNIMVAVGDLARDIKDLTESDIKPMLARIHSIVQGLDNMMGDQNGAAGGELRKMIEAVATTTPQIVENINTFSKRVEALASERNVKAIDGIISNLGKSGDNMAEFTAQLGGTRKALDALVAEIRTMVVDNKLDVERTVVDLRHSAETVARYIDSINQNLDIASRNMMEFSHAIRQNPGLLLGGTPPADNARPER